MIILVFIFGYLKVSGFFSNLSIYYIRLTVQTYNAFVEYASMAAKFYRAFSGISRSITSILLLYFITA